MNREQYLAYMKEYNKKIKYFSKPMSSSNLIDGIDDIYNHTHLVVNPTNTNFKGTDKDEPIICSEFGCDKELSNTEKLCGNRCIHHQQNKKIEPSRYVSYHIKKTV